MTVEGPATGSAAMNNDDIIAKYAPHLRKLMECCKEPIYESERQIRITQARTQWMMVRGDHFGAPDFADGAYGFDGSYQAPYDTGSLNARDNGAQPRLCPPVNLIGGDCYKFRAVMGQNAPRVQAFPDDVRDPDLVEGARSVNVNLRDIWKKQEVDAKWNEISFHLYTTGPAFVYTPWNTDRTKYGKTEEPQFEVAEGPDGVPVPQQIGVKEYANGDAEVEVFSIIECAGPWRAKSLEEFDWQKLERMLSKYVLLDKFKGNGEMVTDPDTGEQKPKPGPLDAYRDTDVPDDGLTAATTSSLEAEAAVARPSGTATVKRKNEWRFAQHWLRPHYFQAIGDQKARECFEQHFPDGIYIATVGDIIVKIDNERNTEVWSVCKVGRDLFINERAMCSDAVPLQRTMDDFWGMTIETLLRAITQTLIDARLINKQAMRSKDAMPVEMIPVALTGTDDLGKAIYQIPPARLSDQIAPIMKLLRDTWVDLVGIRPEIAGGGTPTQTYREAKNNQPAGYQNVLLRWQAQNLLANPVPPPPPPVHGSLAMSAKLEDFPQLLQPALTAAGVQMPPPSAPPVAPPPGPGLPGPAPMGGPPSPPQQEAPMPPMPGMGGPPPGPAPPMGP